MATWTSAYINDLPDSAFACIDSAGRHYPHHDASGAVDMPHLRNALSRVNQSGTASCGQAHLQKHADAAGMGEGKATMDKTLTPLKATLLDDDAFRLLALPYGGPIPYPGAPRGADLDRQWMTERTDWGHVPKRVPVTWHHGQDRVMGKAELGEAGELEFDDEGGWVTVWLKHGERRVNLVRRLADEGARIFGSSEGIPGSGRIRRPESKSEVPWKPRLPGEITRWHYSGQTLSTSPQNTASILVPVKATLDELASGELDAAADFFYDLSSFLDTLESSPETAKAGRVLAGRNEARLLQVREHIDEAYYDPKRRRAAIETLEEVLRELEQYAKTDT